MGCTPPLTPAPSQQWPATSGGWVSDTDTGRAARSFGSEKHTCGSLEALCPSPRAPRAVPRIKPNGPRSSPAGAGPTRSGPATDVQFNFLKHQGWAFLRGQVAPAAPGPALERTLILPGAQRPHWPSPALPFSPPVDK